jgi:hypothetical protein
MDLLSSALVRLSQRLAIRQRPQMDADQRRQQTCFRQGPSASLHLWFGHGLEINEHAALESVLGRSSLLYRNIEMADGVIAADFVLGKSKGISRRPVS